MKTWQKIYHVLTAGVVLYFVIKLIMNLIQGRCWSGTLICLLINLSLWMQVTAMMLEKEEKRKNG